MRPRWPTRPHYFFYALISLQPLQWSPDGRWIAFIENRIERIPGGFSFTGDSGLKAIAASSRMRFYESTVTTVVWVIRMSSKSSSKRNQNFEREKPL